MELESHDPPRKQQDPVSKLVPELVRDQIRGLLKQENAYIVEYIPCSDLFLHDDERTPLDEWRRKICTWAFRVIDHFRLDRDIVAHGLNLLDRFLVAYCPMLDEHLRSRSCPCPACKRALDGETYQLAAMTCMYLAIKLHVDNGTDDDYARRKHFKIETFADLSRGLFHVCDICNMEQTILYTLQWRISSPTPMTFVSYFLTVMPDRERIVFSARRRYDLALHVLRELSRYLTELAVSLGSDCIYYLPSQIAYASILVSMEMLTLEALPQSIRDRFSRRVLLLCQWSNRNVIVNIGSLLKKTLWPDMLLDEGDPTDPGHPISMARQYGILNAVYTCGPTCVCDTDNPPGTPPRKHLRTALEVSGSPVGVERLVHDTPPKWK